MKLVKVENGIKLVVSKGAKGDSIEWKGEWSPTVVYDTIHVVSRGGASWISKQSANIGHDPLTDDGTWWECMVADSLAEGYRDEALTYRNQAEDFAESAATSAANAATSETNAAISAQNAAESEANASASETKARQWAENPEDVEVEDGKYSAYHWAQKAGQIAVSPPHGDEAHTEDYIKEGDDRLADARMPLAHAQTHVDGTDDIQLATSSQKGLMSSAYAAKLDGIEENANNYSLPTASETVKGGIKVGSGLTMEGETLNADVQTKTHWVNMVIDWGGLVIEPGVKGDLTLPECMITEVMLLANESGSIVIDLWKNTYDNFPPTEADSITGSSKPTISSATKVHDSALTGWTTNITEGDILRVNVESCTAIKRCTLALKLII